MRNCPQAIVLLAAMLLAPQPGFADVQATFPCATFGAGCTNAIPAGAPNTSSGPMAPSLMPLPNFGTLASLTDLNVSVKINHTWRGDLRIFIYHMQSNTQLELLSDIGGSNNDANDVDVTFDDEAAVHVSASPCAATNMACTGTFKPENGPLSIFDGINPTGQWQLSIVDAGGGDTGSLVSWSLQMTLRDTDGDGIIDGSDNCNAVANPTQSDVDGDGAGDACDKCPTVPDANQADTDADGVGDACDNCRLAANATQADRDDDGRGDVCDNCPDTPNFSQTDDDKDNIGNVCDAQPSVPAVPQAPVDPGSGNNSGDGGGDATNDTPVPQAAPFCGAPAAAMAPMTLLTLWSWRRRPKRSTL
jgi:subtilisin-like proprotein convertase family protein